VFINLDFPRSPSYNNLPRNGKLKSKTAKENTEMDLTFPGKYPRIGVFNTLNFIGYFKII